MGKRTKGQGSLKYYQEYGRHCERCMDPKLGKKRKGEKNKGDSLEESKDLNEWEALKRSRH